MHVFSYENQLIVVILMYKLVLGERKESKGWIYQQIKLGGEITMKDYLNKNERVQLLFLKKYIDVIENIIEEWGDRNNLTKEESKALKMGKSWGLKAFNSIFERLNDSAAKTFWNSIKDAYINVQDKYAADLYYKKLKSSLDDVYEENKDYYKLVELIMEHNCKNCKKKCTECDMYKEFEEHCIPEPTGEDMGNCRYAYMLPEKI